MNRLQQLLEFSEKNPGDSFIMFALAKEYEKLNDPDSALTCYLNIENQDPDYVGLYYHLGKLYETKGNPEKALLTYDKGMVVAKKLGDNHTFSELVGAKELLNDE